MNNLTNTRDMEDDDNDDDDDNNNEDRKGLEQWIWDHSAKVQARPVPVVACAVSAHAIPLDTSFHAVQSVLLHFFSATAAGVLAFSVCFWLSQRQESFSPIARQSQQGRPLNPKTLNRSKKHPVFATIRLKLPPVMEETSPPQQKSDLLHVLASTTRLTEKFTFLRSTLPSIIFHTHDPSPRIWPLPDGRPDHVMPVSDRLTCAQLYPNIFCLPPVPLLPLHIVGNMLHTIIDQFTKRDGEANHEKQRGPLVSTSMEVKPSLNCEPLNASTPLCVTCQGTKGKPRTPIATIAARISHPWIN
ncbi:hypothetical protein QR685DRAFT_608381 [Neurospora intermedia]|uniref:Uncharacterized protein n=1 Tax=Neurospora intermedia TaxID=5142 RepID=A0ABR3D4E1_NEUIN